MVLVPSELKNNLIFLVASGDGARPRHESSSKQRWCYLYVAYSTTRKLYVHIKPVSQERDQSKDKNRRETNESLLSTKYPEDRELYQKGRFLDQLTVFMLS
jgi:hypothetical protein